MPANMKAANRNVAVIVIQLQQSVKIHRLFPANLSYF